MNKKKINIAILFGGKSAEHEVSLQSAKNIFEAIDKEKYNTILIGIDKTGRWFLNDSSKFLLSADNIGEGNQIVLAPQSNGQLFNLTKKGNDITIDVAFPVLHGPFGEDGTVQGLLKLANIPFVGSSVLGSAVGMDKDVMKRLLRDANIPTCKFMVVKSNSTVPDFENIKNSLGLPFFIKPANMGSSIGVSKIHDQTEYQQKMKNAFNYDTKIMIEEYIEGREIECSVLGNDRPIASITGEILPSHEFYSYEAKYIDEKCASMEIPAKISSQIEKQIQDLAIQTFQATDCQGLGRVDFFLKDNGEVIVNEINSMPGFTKISMYPKLWEASGINYTELIDRLIQLAMERFNTEQKLQTNYL